MADPRPKSPKGLFAALNAEASQEPLGPLTEPVIYGVMEGREEAIRETGEGRHFNRAIRRVPPARCRIWAGHNRRYDLLDEGSCADLVESFRTKGGQQFAAIVRRVKDDPNHDWEVICGARRHWTATFLQMELLIEDRVLSDEDAFAVADKENRSRKDISDYERSVDYLKALDLYYGGKQSRMAQVIGMSESYLSRYLDVARLDPLIVAAVADVRAITINQVREFKAGIEGKRGQATAPGRREARERVLDLARELSEETPKRPAQEVFTALMAAALEEATRKRGRRPSTLATIHAKRSGRVAVRARRSSNGTLVLELPGNSGASMEEVKEGISRLAEEHYRSADSASEG